MGCPKDPQRHLIMVVRSASQLLSSYLDWQTQAFPPCCINPQNRPHAPFIEMDQISVYDRKDIEIKEIKTVNNFVKQCKDRQAPYSEI
jgi:hypothetical protein